LGGQFGGFDNLVSDPIEYNLPIQNGAYVSDVAAGTDFTVALSSDNKLVSCGENRSGQLGTGTQDQSVLFVSVNTTAIQDKTVISISSGDGFTMLLTTDGQTYGFGAAIYGQIGDVEVTSFRSLPTATFTSGELSGKKIVQIATGNDHTLALTSDGVVYAW
jgi:alpha-tubulin suppressor-like RCC1 family protein